MTHTYRQQGWLEAESTHYVERDLGRGTKCYRAALRLGKSVRFLGGIRRARTAANADQYAKAVQERYIDLMVVHRRLEETKCQFCGAWYMDDRCWKRQFVRAAEWVLSGIVGVYSQWLSDK